MPQDMYKSKDEEDMAEDAMGALGGGGEESLVGGELPAEEEVAADDQGMMDEEMGAEPMGLEGKLQDLVASWTPSTPEGEQYKADLEAALADYTSEMGGEEGMEEGMEEEGGSLEPEGFGFNIGLMGKEAAKRAMGGSKGA